VLLFRVPDPFDLKGSVFAGKSEGSRERRRERWALRCGFLSGLGGPTS